MVGAAIGIAVFTSFRFFLPQYKIPHYPMLLPDFTALPHTALIFVTAPTSVLWQTRTYCKISNIKQPTQTLAHLGQGSPEGLAGRRVLPLQLGQDRPDQDGQHQGRHRGVVGQRHGGCVCVCVQVCSLCFGLPNLTNLI